MQFLGHIVSRDGVAMDPEKVANWPVPQNKREVQQFLGLASYYQYFVRDYATIAKPLHRLTEKNPPLKWTSASQEAFENLCQRLVLSPILAFPDSSFLTLMQVTLILGLCCHKFRMMAQNVWSLMPVGF